MTAHTNAEMACAKLNNMDLVVFVKAKDGWRKCHCNNVPCNESREYYLCHPNHVTECEYWLSGGDVWAGINLLLGDMWRDWHPLTPFMNPDLDIKIAPKKEKRWVLVNPATYNAYSYKTKAEALEADNVSTKCVERHQVVEIMIEVK